MPSHDDRERAGKDRPESVDLLRGPPRQQALAADGANRGRVQRLAGRPPARPSGGMTHHRGERTGRRLRWTPWRGVRTELSTEISRFDLPRGSQAHGFGSVSATGVEGRSREQDLPPQPSESPPGNESGVRRPPANKREFAARSQIKSSACGGDRIGTGTGCYTWISFHRRLL